jgi:ABC-type polar amino acid transport system ATPase subunit
MRELAYFCYYTFGVTVGGGILEMVMKKRFELKEKLANGHLITKDDIKDILGNDGLILSKDIQLRQKYDYEGSVIFGATGSKKTTSIYAPNLLRNDIKGSIIVTDPKESSLSIQYEQLFSGSLFTPMFDSCTILFLAWLSVLLSAPVAEIEIIEKAKTRAIQINFHFLPHISS